MAQQGALEVRSRYENPWLIATLAALVILGIAYFFMRSMGLFDLGNDPTGLKTLAAALAFVGSIVTAAVTLVGTVLKYSIDDRNLQLSIEAEKRNRVETAIRAVDLLGEDNKNATEHEMGGALLALVSLGEVGLAVSLLGELWRTQSVSFQVAERVIAEAMNSDSKEITTAAAVVLRNNAKEIVRDESLNIWPFDEGVWRAELCVDARRGLALAASEWLLIELEKNPGKVPLHGPVMLTPMLDDPDSMVCAHAVEMLRAIAEGFADGSIRGSKPAELVDPYGTIELVKLREYLGKYPEQRWVTGTLADRVRSAIARATPQPSAPASHATIKTERDQAANAA